MFTWHLDSFVFNWKENSLATILDVANETDNGVTLKETGKPNSDDSSPFWLNSGAWFYFKNGIGHTILGDLPAYSPWRLTYKVTNPTDTDEGYHPQNIFRLITKEFYRDATQSVRVLIVNDNLSESLNRNQSNGVFLMSRYVDSDNLYYAGIRVDGMAVIKKKISGVYHTLAEVKVFAGDPYDRNINPSLLPKNQWVGIKVTVVNTDKNSVTIDLSLDKNNTGEWTPVLTALDISQSYDPLLLTKGRSGVRSDFMDIEIKDYKIDPIGSP